MTPRAGAAHRRVPALDDRRRDRDERPTAMRARGRAIVRRQGRVPRLATPCGGDGSRVGPDLTRIGLVRRAASSSASLLEPEAEVQPENRFYKVTPKSGEAVIGPAAESRHVSRCSSSISTSGCARSRSPIFREHGFDARRCRRRATSFSTQEIADVVSYLVVAARRGRPYESTNRKSSMSWARVSVGLVAAGSAATLKSRSSAS